VHRLSEAEITKFVGELAGWRLDGKFIFKKYRFREFLKGISFVHEIANLSEEKKSSPLYLD
jgi:4a-hydroxytetrahydrobiopterin dehydratase